MPPLSHADLRAAAEFRAWNARLRTRPPTKRPLATLRRARGDLDRVGRDVEATAGVPRWRQLVELWWLRQRYGHDWESYVNFQLYRPERRALAALYVSDSQHTFVTRWLHRAYAERGSDGPRILDKRRFPEWCAEHGLPAPPVLVEWDDGRLVHSALDDGELPAADLFTKPADMNQGFGAARWRWDGAGGYVGRDGRRRTADALRAELAALSASMPQRTGSPRATRLLLQAALANDPRNAPLTNGALCTVRVVTYRAPDGAPAVAVASYKMALGDAPADNFHFGGMLAPVDVATGRLGAGVRRHGRALVPVNEHPDTGARIPGHLLAHWPAAEALARRAHASARLCPVFGWDVALTPTGPMLLEGNIDPDPGVSQAPSGKPLGATPYLAALNAHLRQLAPES